MEPLILTLRLEISMVLEWQEFGSIRVDIQLIVSLDKHSAPFDETLGNSWAISFEPWGNHLNQANLMGRMSADFYYKQLVLAPTLYSAINTCKAMGFGCDV
mgnify:CR=1 FL=1